MTLPWERFLGLVTRSNFITYAKLYAQADATDKELTEISTSVPPEPVIISSICIADSLPS